MRLRKNKREREGRGLEEKKALSGLLPMAQIPSEQFLQHTGYSLERGGNSAAPYFPLRSDLYVFHTVLPQRVLTSTSSDAVVVTRQYA